VTVYYVSKAGNDSNDGTFGSPKLTIANACGVADGGTDNIVEIIDSGVYSEGDIDILGNPITVRATGSNKPIMDGDSSNNDYAFVPYISGSVFMGLHMRNYDDGLINTSYGISPECYILSGCIGHFLGGPQQIGDNGNPARHAEVHDCLIVSDGNAAFTCQDGKVWFNNSVIASNKPGYAVIDSAQSKVNITASFCTIIGSSHNNSSGQYGNIVNQVYKIINCIVSGSGDGINAYDSTYNLVHVSGDPFIQWSSDSHDGTPRAANTGEITGNPLFQSGSDPGTVDPVVLGNVDFDTQWFKLTTGSPAIAAGTSYGSVTADISGSERSTPPSMGAYEFVTSDPDWSSHFETPGRRYDAALTDRRYEKSLGEYEYRYSDSNRQIPFQLNIPGAPSLRRRKTPYSSSI